MPLPLPRLLALLATLAVLSLAAAASPARAASCPSSFRVLHDDRIGALSLPAGNYHIDATRLSCATASSLFTTFLQDYDGHLPNRWRVTVQGVGRGTFRQGTAGPSFSVRKLGGTTGGNTGGLVCAAPYRLTQTERIGPLLLKRGPYRIDRLGPLSPNCRRAASLLTRFLQDFDGVLPGGWTLLNSDGAFVHRSLSKGFRIKPYSGGGGGGGGGRYPTRTTRCPATFRVGHNDRIGPLRFPAGPYWVSIYKRSNLSCPQTTQLFARFLQRPDGSLPRPWVISPATGSFRRRGTAHGFVAKPAFRVR